MFHNITEAVLVIETNVKWVIRLNLECGIIALSAEKWKWSLSVKQSKYLASICKVECDRNCRKWTLLPTRFKFCVNTEESSQYMQSSWSSLYMKSSPKKRNCIFFNPNQQEMAVGTHEFTNDVRLVFASHAFGRNPTGRRRKTY